MNSPKIIAQVVVISLLIGLAQNLSAQTNQPVYYSVCMSAPSPNNNVWVWWTPKTYTNITLECTKGAGVWTQVCSTSLAFGRTNLIGNCNTPEAVYRIKESP